MNTQLENIENWLKMNANKIAELSLQEPATEEQIEELESAIGKTLPQDFKELYQWHNGLTSEDNLGSLFFGLDFLPIEQVLDEYYDRESYDPIGPLEKYDKEIDPSNVLNPHWIKFGFDGAHTGLYMDLAPSEQGKYGQIIFVDDEYDTAILVANSITELVANFVKDLEDGLYYLHPEALEDNNHYLQTDTANDIVNWQSSEKWSRE